MEHFADRLLEAIEDKGSPVCVGLDPVWEKLPEEFREGTGVPSDEEEIDIDDEDEDEGEDDLDDEEIEQAEAIGDFCHEVLEIVETIVPAVKIQSAYFEKYGSVGVDLYEALISRAQDLGLVVIGDVKRNDIGSTAAAYAQGHLHTPEAADRAAADAITVNGYFGADGLASFVQAAREEGKGIFVLVRTSNPSAKAIQDFADAAGKKFFEHLAGEVAAIGSAAELIGEQGYSCVGAVVGATYPDEARRLRAIMPQQIFLVPGYGAQGATAADCAAAFKPDGLGAIVNASRSVIFAHADKKYASPDWRHAIERSARDFARDIRQAIGR